MKKVWLKNLKIFKSNKESISNLKKINKIEEKGDMRERLEERYLILALRLQKPKIDNQNC